MPLYLVRHGETNWNREKRFQSITDVALNDRGREQAAALRAELQRRKVSFCAARCSPLGRAVETACIILEGSGLEPVIEPRFIEVSLGAFEGRLEADLRLELGEAYDQWRAMQYTLAAPGGESILDAAARVAPALQLLRPLAAGGNVLVVAHQAVNMAMKVALSGRTDRASAAEFRQNNHEVDIWDMAAGRQLERFFIETP